MFAGRADDPPRSHGTAASAPVSRELKKVAANDIGIRPKVRDIGFHRLRANVASLIEWLRICLREGWLGNPRRNHRGTTRSSRTAVGASPRA